MPALNVIRILVSLIVFIGHHYSMWFSSSWLHNGCNPIYKKSGHITFKWPHQKAQGFRLDKKAGPIYFCLQETHFRQKDTYNLKIKGWRTIYHSNGPQKKAGAALLGPAPTPCGPLSSGKVGAAPALGTLAPASAQLLALLYFTIHKH